MHSRSLSVKGWLSYYTDLIGSWVKNNALKQDAEDAAQDAIMRVLADQRDSIQDPKAYLFRAAQNQLVSEIRRQARHEQTSLDTLLEHEHPQSHGEVDASLHTTELLGALCEALQDLPLKCQQVFLWNKIEGYTQEEVARRLGLTPSAVEKHMKRALRHIQHRLQDYGPHR
ncbi:RNA polymerase sigma factor [Paenalcaligenes suwonensis]|uniref:RNA polymerase sigma factor n=1 Tax=Paenalcaligenes suwonensis TaxID=1202713 RepID=UPI00140D9B54|nr:RNA polymerase sigma factor [Paenalcaligenes suwonensis]NHC60763.1 RNA polymerase sigma factor [Paenalcaligenes suwonensis]